MVTAFDKTIKDIGGIEFEVEDFKQRLLNAIRVEREKARDLADKEAKMILAKAYQESSCLIDRAKEESNRLIQLAQTNAQNEYQTILSQARQQSEKMINLAEETIRKEAREKTRKEVESILRNTRDEAAKSSQNILQSAREQATAMITNAKQEAVSTSLQITEAANKQAEEVKSSANQMRQKAAEELVLVQKRTTEAVDNAISECREKALSLAEIEAGALITKAKEEAQKEYQRLIDIALTEAKSKAAIERESLLQLARTEAESILDQAKSKVRSQMENSKILMQEIQAKLDKLVSSAAIETVKPTTVETPPLKAAVQNIPKISEVKLTVTEKTEQPPIVQVNAVIPETQNKINTLFGQETGQVYKGKLKVDIAPPADSEQINDMERQLLQNDNLRILAKGGAEDGSAWLELEISQPLPLLSILRKIPCVKEVVGAKSYIIVALKAT